MSTVAVERALSLDQSDVGVALLGIVEDQWFDRKSARIDARDLGDALIGFANGEGGTIVIGLWDGEVEGIANAGPKKLASWQQAALDFTTPAVPARARVVDCVNRDSQSDQVLVVQVETSDFVHANRKDEVFLRVGDENRRLTFTQRQELTFDKGQASYEATALEGAELDDLNVEVLGQYAEAVNHPDPHRLLTARGLLDRHGHVTVAAMLLFGQSPQRFLPETTVRILRYRGDERGSGSRQQLISDHRVEGCIPLQLREARLQIAEALPTRRALDAATGRFEQIPLIPEDAWLEGLVNAVIHRSYSITGDHIRIEIFDDRIEIESPGRFPGIADPGRPLEITRFARNPRIARVCSDLRFGQELGEGIRRIFDEMRLAGLSDPSYMQTSGSTSLKLSSIAVDRELEDRLARGARDVLRFIREAGRASTGDVAEATARSRPSALKQLRSLESEGLIEWIGNSSKDPRAYWKLRVE